MSKPHFISVKPIAPPAAAPVNTLPDPDFNGIGSKVSAYSEEHNIPKQVRSKEPVPASAKPALVTVVQPRRLRRLTVDIPDYVFDDIEERAKKSTMKYVVLNAFHKAGLHVAADDLVEDGRRREKALP